MPRISPDSYLHPWVGDPPTEKIEFGQGRSTPALWRVPQMADGTHEGLKASQLQEQVVFQLRELLTHEESLLEFCNRLELPYDTVKKLFVGSRPISFEHLGQLLEKCVGAVIVLRDLPDPFGWAPMTVAEMNARNYGALSKAAFKDFKSELREGVMTLLWENGLKKSGGGKLKITQSFDRSRALRPATGVVDATGVDLEVFAVGNLPDQLIALGGALRDDGRVRLGVLRHDSDGTPLSSLVLEIVRLTGGNDWRFTAHEATPA